MTKSFTYTFIIAAVFSCAMCAETPPPASAAKQDGLSKAFQNARPIGKNVYSLTGKKNEVAGKSTDQRLEELKDDDILVSIEGWDALKWGLLRRHVEVLCDAVENRPEMQAEGNESMKKIARKMWLRKLLKDYLEHAVFAVEAKRMGITVKSETFDEYRAKAREGFKQMGESGKPFLAMMDGGESFYEHNLTNALYWQAYKEQVAAPLCGTDDNEIARMIQMRHAANMSTVATNLQKKALIAEIHGKLKDGMEFGDAAEKWSDCESSATRGVMMDSLDEHPERFSEGDLSSPIWSALSGLKEGEMSGVVETPMAWHIVRLLKRNPSKDDEDETVEIAQIMIEKDMLDPEFSPKGARSYIESIKMKMVMKAKFSELVQKVKIDSKIPLWDSSNSNSKRRRFYKKIK